MTLDHVFVPPPGALQFECTNTPSGGPPPARLKSFWVLPAIPENIRDRRCACAMVYPIILESLPSDIATKSRRKMTAQGFRHAVVCTCVGRIIE